VVLLKVRWFLGPDVCVRVSVCMGCRFKGLGSILGYLEVMGVMVFSFVERWFVGAEERKVKASSYMQLTCCLLGSSYFSTVGEGVRIAI